MSNNGTHWWRWGVALVVAVWIAMFAIRHTAPSDFLDQDQERPAAYMADAVVNGHWIVQRDDQGAVNGKYAGWYIRSPADQRGDVCSKPPVYTWMGAAIMVFGGGTSRFGLYFPSALAVLGTALLLCWTGRRWFGAATGVYAALIFLLSMPGLKMVHLARTDSLFTFFVFATAVCGLLAWERGRGWTWFWLLAVLGTLTKGPLALVFAASGFVAAFRRGLRTGAANTAWRVLVPGVPLFLLLAGGWLALAYLALGQPVLDKMLVRELVGHAVSVDGKSATLAIWLAGLFKPVLYLLARFAPWSILVLLAGVRLWRVEKAAQGAEWRAAWFCFWAVAVGVLLLGLGRHHRPDLIFPLLPLAALLAGRELTLRLGERVTSQWGLVVSGVLAVAVLIGAHWYYGQRRVEAETVIRQSAQLEDMAWNIKDRMSPPEPVWWIFVDTPYGFQFCLNQMQFRVTPAEAARSLQLPMPVAVVVQDAGAVMRLLPANVMVWCVWEQGGQGGSVVRIVANRKANWFKLVPENNSHDIVFGQLPDSDRKTDR